MIGELLFLWRLQKRVIDHIGTELPGIMRKSFDPRRCRKMSGMQLEEVGAEKK